MRVKIGPCAVIVAVLVAGVASPRPAKAASTDDACSLLTPAQVGTVVGVAMGVGVYAAPTYKKTCTWAPFGIRNKTEIGYVTLSFGSGVGYSAAKQLAEMANARIKAKGQGTPEMVVTLADGVGDEAYYEGVGKAAGLNVRKGSVAFKVAVYADLPVDKKEAMEKKLALQVLSKL
jgi:hypothetical protein